MKNPAEDLLGGGSGGNCGDGGESAIDSIEECLPPSDDNGLQQAQLSSGGGGGGSVCCGQLERLDCDRSREPMAMAPSSVGIIWRVIGVKSNIDCCCCLLLSR